MSNRFLFTTGGTVPPNDGSYIARQADETLLELCQQGRFAYVLTARQMGKSSLMVATANTLREQGIRPVIIDLTQIGSQTASAAEWYLGVLRILARQLRLNAQLTEFWNGHSDLSVTQRFTQFFEEEVLSKIETPIVVFVDEIDSTLSLDFTDDFFIAIRYFYTARVQNPVFNRLSFVLVGVATPSELISDQKRTPFNIGDRVDLSDFTFEEALPLSSGLGLPEAEAQQVLQWVLEWTGGHPYLTQRLCKEVKAETEQGQTAWAKADVEGLTKQLFFGDRREQDNNLQFVRDMLTRRTPGEDVLGVLGTYRQIRRGRVPVLDEDQSVVKAHLKLSGVVKREDQQLQVRNPIYSGVFDLKWLREQWPETWWERLKPAMPLIAGLSVVAVGMGGLAWYANDQRLNAIAAATEAETERDNAQVAKQQALTAATEAKTERDNAQVAEQRAIRAEQSATERRKEAEAAEQEAEDQRQQAVVAQQAEAKQRQRAEVGEAEANKQAGIARDQTAIANINLDRAIEARAIAQQETLKAETQALNAEIQAEALTVENLVAADLTTSAMLRAIAMGKRLRTERVISLLNAGLASKEQSEIIGNTVNAAVPQKAVLQPSTYMQAVSTLRELYYFNGYLQRNILQGHTGDVNSVSFSPDGQTLASGSSDGTVKLWDKSGRELQTLQGHTRTVNSVSFSPDGQTLASASEDRMVKLWDRSGRELQTLQGHTGEVLSLGFSPDGQTLAGGSYDGTIKLWDRSGRELQTLQSHTRRVRSVSFSPDGQTLAGGSYDGTVKLWDKSGRELQTLQGHMREVNSVSFSPDGQTLASGSQDDTVKLWDRSGRELQTLQGHTNWVRSVSFSPDGQTLASGSSEIKLWDRSGRELQTLQGHTGDVNSVSFSPDGQTLASSSYDGTVKLWDKSGRELQTLQGHMREVNSVSFSPDGQTLASGSSDGTLKLWDKSGRELQTLQGHTGDVRSVSFSPDGQTLASGSSEVKLWDRSGRELQTLQGHTGEVLSLSFSPDGQTLAIGSYDGTVKLWNRIGRELQTLQGHTGGVWSVSFSPDGQTLASSSYDGTVKLWDRSGQELQTLQGHTEWVLSVSFSPDGQTLASASGDGTVKLWDRSGRELQILQGHTGWVWSVSFSPDGQTLASASGDGTVKLWDRSGRELQSLEGHTDIVRHVSFSPDGQTLASASDDGTVILWNFNLDDLVAKSCHWLRDYMTNPATPAEERALCAADLGLSTQSPNPLQTLQATLRTIPTELHRTYTAIKDRASGS